MCDLCWKNQLMRSNSIISHAIINIPVMPTHVDVLKQVSLDFEVYFLKYRLHYSIEN